MIMIKPAAFKHFAFLISSVLIYVSAYAQPNNIGQASSREFAKAYSGQASVTTDKGIMTIKSNTGAAFSQMLTNTSSLISGADEKGRKFNLVFKGADPNVSAVLTVGSLSLTAAGTTSQIITDLNKQINANPNALQIFPQSAAITKLVARVHTDPSILKEITGPTTSLLLKDSSDPKDRYCTAVCEACGKGGPFSPWFCLSCASCDVFSSHSSGIHGPTR